MRKHYKVAPILGWSLVMAMALTLVLLPGDAQAVTTRLNSLQIGTSATNGYVAVTDGTNTTWTDPATIGTIGVAGSDTQVQFNDGGVFGAQAGFSFTKASDALTIAGLMTCDGLTSGIHVSAVTEVTAGTDMTAGGVLYITEQSASSPDTAGDGQIWMKDTSPTTPFFTGDTGVDHPLLSREPYEFGAVDPVPFTLLTNMVDTAAVAHTGTITRIQVYVGVWNVVTLTDTLTITLTYGAIGATATTTVTSTSGARSTFGGDKAISITQGHILQVATSTSADDNISEITVVVIIEN